MNSTLTLSDPGAILGKTFLKIGQVILTLLLLGCGFMAYLASDGFFTGWDVEFDSDVASIFQGRCGRVHRGAGGANRHPHVRRLVTSGE